MCNMKFIWDMSYDMHVYYVICISDMLSEICMQHGIRHACGICNITVYICVCVMCDMNCICPMKCLCNML